MTALDDLIEWAGYRAGTEGAQEARRLGEAIAKEVRNSLLTNNVARHDISCPWSRLGYIDPASGPCSCGLFDDIRMIEADARAALIDELLAAVRALADGGQTDYERGWDRAVDGIARLLEGARHGK